MLDPNQWDGEENGCVVGGWGGQIFGKLKLLRTCMEQRLNLT